MVDLCQLYGNDIQLSATGDLLMVSGDSSTQQTVLRRLLTNPLDDLWNIHYGAGLGAFVGIPASASQIGAVVRAQMMLEAAVSQNPAPSVQVVVAPDGSVVASISYADAVSGQSQSISVPVAGG
jgi:hypothetical protein